MYRPIRLNPTSKFGSVRTEYNGRVFDSKFEAEMAVDLDLQVKAGQIAAWEPQYMCKIQTYRKNGDPAVLVTHRVDFRVKHTDGTFELVEAKGVETMDYKMRRKFLEAIWLPEHPDHRYTVIKKQRRYRGR